MAKEGGRNNEMTVLLGGCTRKSSSGPQMIPDRKFEPQMSWIGNDPHIGLQMIPTKNKEWHRFISEDDETIYKNYKLKKCFILEEIFPT